MKKTRVGVIFGGRSGEHEVSLASAAAVFQNLDPEKYEAIPIRIEKDGRWALPTRAPNVMKAADVIHAIGETDTRDSSAPSWTKQRNDAFGGRSRCSRRARTPAG